MIFDIVIFSLRVILREIGCYNEHSNGFTNVAYYHGEKYLYEYAPGSGTPASQYVTDIGEKIGQLEDATNSNQSDVYAIKGIDPKESIALKIVSNKGEIHYIKLTHTAS